MERDTLLYMDLLTVADIAILQKFEPEINHFVDVCVCVCVCVCVLDI